MIEVKEKITFTIENDDKVYDSDNQDIIILLPELINHNKELLEKYFTSKLKAIPLPTYLRIYPYHENLALVKVKRNTYIYIDKNGNQAIPHEFYDARSFSEGLALVQTTEEIKRHSFIDKNCNIIISNIEEARDFHDGRAAIKVNGRWGFINKEGKITISCVYNAVSDYSEGLAAVQCDNGLWKYVAKDGYEFIQDKFSFAGDFHDGLALVKEGKITSFINKEGRKVISLGDDCKYISSFYNNFALYYTDNGINFIDKNGNKLFKTEKYNKARSFSLSRASVFNGDKWGYIDENGTEIIPCIYNEAYDFQENGLALVCRDGKWGYINTNGEEVIPLKYKDAESFSEGLALVTNQDDEKYFININSEIQENFPKTSNNLDSYLELIKLLSNQQNSHITVALNIKENKIHFVKSWEKQTVLVNEKGEKITLSQEDYQELTKKLAKK